MIPYLPKLVFFHGWGFDQSFWQPLTALLSHYDCTLWDAGFFGHAVPVHLTENTILVGHSYGFMCGLSMQHHWRAAIGINAFLRFGITPEKNGCVSLSTMRAMQRELLKNPVTILHDFHARLGSTTPHGHINTARLHEALEYLREADVSERIDDQPFCVLSGADDALVPPAMRDEMSAHATAHHIKENAGHLLPLTHTRWCAEKIHTFVNGLPC